MQRYKQCSINFLSSEKKEVDLRATNEGEALIKCQDLGLRLEYCHLEYSIGNTIYPLKGLNHFLVLIAD
jgi:hypothetical protein